MSKEFLLSDKQIADKIYLIRGEKVMLDSDLAALYGVSTSALNQAVKRNTNRFPPDFMFQLTQKESDNLISQFVISSADDKPGWGGRRKLPNVFTEQGVAMLSSVLTSEVAVSVNIQIIRVFTRMRTLLQSNAEILKKLDQLEKKMMKQDESLQKHEEEITIVFNAIKQLLEQTTKPAVPATKTERKKIGFRRKTEEEKND